MPLALLIALVLPGLRSVHDPWDRFRGPSGSGLAPRGVKLPDELDRGKNLAWSADLPAGHSSPCLTARHLFLTGASDDGLMTIGLDRTNGAIAWKRLVKADALERTHEINGPATPTPATDGSRVIAAFGSFGLVAYDLDGEELWRREQATPKNTFGTAASPIIVDGKLLFLSDSETGSFLEALEPATGNTLWRRERPRFQSGWSTPGLWSRTGRNELLVLGVGWLTAHDLLDGSELWSYPGLTDEPITTPITGDGLVFATSYNLRTNDDAMQLWSFARVLAEHDHDGDGMLDADEAAENSSVLSRPDAGGEGDHPLAIFQRFLDVDRDGHITAQEYTKLQAWVDSWEHLNGIVALRPGTAEGPAELVWHYSRGVPECPSPLYCDGRVYMVMNGGAVTCLDAKTGREVFQGRLPARGPYYASLVGGDGKVYAASARGEVTIFSAVSELRVLSSLDLGERLMATPALSDGMIFVRTETHIYAFGAGD